MPEGGRELYEYALDWHLARAEDFPQYAGGCE